MSARQGSKLVLFLVLFPCLQTNGAEFLNFLASIQDIIQEILPSDKNGIGECKGCFCIPEKGDSCPSSRPTTDFSSLIPVLRSFTWENPYSLNCDPYNDDSCDTMPPLEIGGACTIEFSGPSGTCPENWTYRTMTYPGTFEEAKSNSSLYVTHATSCGTCSSLQDLSVYMESGGELRDESSACGFRGRKSQEDGIKCFQELGFTEACATTWFYNTKQTAAECIGLCVPFTLLGLPANKSPPKCKLASCLECDEVKAGPVFKEFAGRTRRNSGLLSNIVRPCSQLVDLEQRNPCTP